MSDGVEDGRLDTGAVAHHAAVRPFHAGIAWGEVWLAEDDAATLEAALAREALHQRFGIVEQTFVDAHDEVRNAAQVLQRLAGRFRNGIEGTRIEGVAGDPAGEGDGKRHRFGLALGVAGIGLSEEARCREAKPRNRIGESGLDLMFGLGAAFLKAAGMSLRRGLRCGGCLLLGGSADIRAAEIGVEQEGPGVQ